MNVRIKLPTFLAAAVAATLFASDLALAQGGERRLLKGSRVAIYNLVGSIRLEGGSGGEVAVTVDRQGSDGARLKVETGEIGGRETLRVIYPDDRIVFERRSGEKGNEGRWGNWGRTQVNVARDGTFGDGRGGLGRGDRVEIVSSGRGFRGYADVRVAVPTGTSIEVHLAAGEAVVTNVDGDITVDVQAADVTTSHTRGALLLDTGSGEVNVSDAEGRVILDSGSGGATVTGMKGRELRLDTGSGSFKGSGIDVEELWGDTGSGRVRLSDVRAKVISLDSGSGSVELGLLSDVDRLTIDAGSGAVTVHVPESLGAAVDIDSGSGGIDVDVAMTVTRRDRDALSGTIGDGRGRIRIDSGAGGVTLRRRAR